MPTHSSKTKNPKIPKLRFPGFEGEWEEKRLGEITKNFDNERVPIKSGKRDTGEYPYYGANGIVDYVEDYLFDGKYVLVAEDGVVDVTKYPVHWVNGKFWANNHAHVLQGNNVLSDFLFYSLRNIKFGRYITGSAQTKLNGNVLNKIIIKIPSDSEQQKIAEFLGAVDGWIENLKKQKEEWESYKKGMMQKIFSPSCHSREGGNPGNNCLRFKDENGKDFPEWEEKKLGEVCEKRSSSVSSNSLEKNTGEYNMYGATGFLKKVDFYQEDKPFISIVKDGAGVGRILLCEAKSSVLGTLDILKPRNIDLYFLYLLLDQISFTKFITGLAIPHIYFKDYSKVKILVPSLSEQHKISSLLTSIDKVINSKQQQIIQAEGWKKGLMQSLFL